MLCRDFNKGEQIWHAGKFLQYRIFKGKIFIRTFKRCTFAGTFGQRKQYFEQAEWGTLKRTKAKHDNQYFELSGEPVALRMQLNPKADFLLEAGFLAETIQLQLGFVTEAIIEKQTSNTVTFLIQVDSKDPIDFADYEQEAASPLHLNKD